MTTGNCSVPATAASLQGDLSRFLPNDSRARLPQQLVNARRWMLWETVPEPDPTKKARKVPYYANGKRRGPTDTPEDWAQLATYDEVLDALVGDVVDTWNPVGIGFALGPDGSGGHWQGVDLDNRSATEVDAFISNHDDLGYVEASPSGLGLHLLGYGRDFRTLGPNGTGYEAYANGRFFTFTGDRGRGVPICIADFVEGPVAERHRKPTEKGAAAGAVYVDPQTVADLRSALSCLRADDRDLWVAVGQALKELGDVGRGLWIDWSMTSDKWKPSDAKTWDSFDGDRTGYAAVFAKAQAAGWINPRSNTAQVGTLASTGVPLEELTFDWDDVEPLPPDIVADLVADEELTLLGGHGGIGKGFLALQLAVGVAVGANVLGHCSTGPHRVLYYSAEDGRKRIGLRMRSLLESYGDEQQALAKQNLRIVDASELDPLYGHTGKSGLGTLLPYAQLQRLVATFDPRLLVIDGASDTFDGNEIVKREVRSFVKLLLRLHPRRRIAVLLIVHIDRASARGHTSNDEGYSGNVAWHNSCRRRLYLQRKVERDEDTKDEVGETILLRVMKNQDGPPTPDIAPVRQPNGFWQTAVSFIGGMERGGDYAPTVLRLIGEYYERGQWISTSLADNATSGVYSTLKSDPHFPPLGKKRTADLVRKLEREQKLTRETYRRGNGGKAERWKLT